jgi:hypothetical protein
VELGAIRVGVRDPAGSVVSLAEWIFLSVPPAGVVDDDKRVRIAAGIYEAPPLLLLADHLRKRSETGVELLEVLRDTGRATHRYVRYRVPDDAPLGRHHVEVDMYVNGQRSRSGTADTDFFQVEELRLLTVEGTGARRRALLHNPSPEPVPVKICEIREVQGGSLECSPRMMSLAPDAQTAIPCPRDGTFLFYAEDLARIALRDPSSPLSVRNPLCRWVASEDGEEVYVRREGDERLHVLRGVALRIWKASNGLIGRAELRRGGAARAYDHLLGRDLILELPVQDCPCPTPDRGPRRVAAARPPA